MDTFDNYEQNENREVESFWGSFAGNTPPEASAEPHFAGPEPEHTGYTSQPFHPQQETPWQEREPVYRGRGVGRKESPFANSPYQRVEQPEAGYRYQPQNQPPQKEPKPKKNRKPFWKVMLAGFLAVVLVAGSCLATAVVVSGYWEDRNEEIGEIDEYN